MSVQNDATIYLYDVDREGGCIMHFLSCKGDAVAVMPGNSVMPPEFFKQQKSMHERSGHTITVELENEIGTVYAVRVGHGNFWLLMNVLSEVVASMVTGMMRRGYDASQN